jgi:hypothetical protein
MFKFKIYIENDLNSGDSFILDKINFILSVSEPTIITESECLNLKKSNTNNTSDIIFIFFKFDSPAFKHLKSQCCKYHYFI